MKTGAPIKDVIIPTGISAGANRVLEIKSEINMKIEPSNIEHGIEYLLSEPIINFEILGIINPTKDIIPAIDTDAAASREEIAIVRYCTRFRFKPSDTESSSPRLRIFSSFEMKSDDNNPMKIIMETR